MVQATKRLLLWLLSASFGAVLAACYGAYHGTSEVFRGKITGKADGIPIPGIAVTLRIDGDDRSVAYSDENGRYDVQVECLGSCPPISMVFADRDGQANGGEFRELTRSEAVPVESVSKDPSSREDITYRRLDVSMRRK